MTARDDKRDALKPWGDDVALRGPDAPKNDGSIKHMIEYLLTVYERFGNTCITANLQWGATAMHKRDAAQQRVAELEAEIESMRSHVAPIDTDRMRAAMACEYSSCVNHDMSKSRCDHCPLEALPSTTPQSEVDEIISGLYKRFKEWSKREFGPEDVTWCEVKADVLALLNTSVASAIEQKPWAWCKSDVNGRPTDILQGAEAQAAKEAGYILTPLYRGASPKDADRLREIEHMVWHVLDESEEDASTGNISIRPSDDYFKLCELLPEGHPEENNSPDGGKQT